MTNVLGGLAGWGLIGSIVVLAGVFVWSLVGYANARDEWEEDRVRQVAKKGIIWSFLSALGCAVTMISVAVTSANGDDDKRNEQKEIAGPIPKKYQGSYHAISCKGLGRLEGLVFVHDDRVAYPTHVDFGAETVVSETTSRVVLRGIPRAMGHGEPEANFSLTYATVGATALIDGSPYIRCSASE